jgi:Flp pilus assembly pilin Flp
MTGENVRAKRRRRVIASRERGASSVEYALLVSLIAAVCALIVSVLGGQVFDLFNSIIF